MQFVIMQCRMGAHSRLTIVFRVTLSLKLCYPFCFKTKETVGTQEVWKISLAFDTLTVKILMIIVLWFSFLFF